MIEREKWIDVLKGIAITAVVFDHIFYLFPYFRFSLLWQHAFFSITWFVFLSGATNSLSAGRKNDWISIKSYISFWKKRINIVYPYFLATFISMFLINPKMITPGGFFLKLVNFSALPPFYFISLILQLYFIFPFIYSLFQKCKAFWQKTGLYLFVFLVSIIAQNIEPIWLFSPAGRYFGGVYLAVFCFGMLFSYKKFVSSKLLFICSLSIFIVYEVFLWLTNGIFISSHPNINLVIWSLTLIILTMKVISKLDKKQPVILLFEYLGRHTLFIYLFHYLILLKLKDFFMVKSPLDFLFIFLSAVIFSLAVEFFYSRIIFVSKSYFKPNI